MSGADITGESDAFYEWLLSDHPDARAERDSRREATQRDELKGPGKSAAGSRRSTHPGRTQTMRDLAQSMGPLAAESAARAEADYAVPDETYVARARANWETYMQVSAPDGSWDYRYPPATPERKRPVSRAPQPSRSPNPERRQARERHPGRQPGAGQPRSPVHRTGVGRVPGRAGGGRCRPDHQH